ncbi:cyclin-dependent kinase inhibitor 3 family protein [Deinococcus sp. 14RED07]|uniref:cyclin-dependent kinase inhibitor 3 family protein n=1 Tax=unclassified Deinococcus TaxID=2623546 RepID=UPI001E4B9D51|nr:cyclin-dependent kinase inhibitor 3 family protein [Deinococcus sp. 6GRE01]MCD0177557.1 cyclin-dependent kinase inhibitor 3 family protein [Deinococcus sp. 14RED07]
MTSAANPIRVDWIPTGLWPGRLGLTFAPGKKGGSVYQPGVTHDRDLTDDMRTLAQGGANVIAPLLEDHEFPMLGLEDYHDAADTFGLEVAPYPIPDGHAPHDPRDFAAYIDELMTYLLNGRSVVVHCRGGLGRAGLSAACLLVQAGLDADDAIALVRETRSPHAIETPQQEQFIHDFAR